MRDVIFHVVPTCLSSYSVFFCPEILRAENSVKKSRWIRAPDLGEPRCCTISQWPQTFFFYIYYYYFIFFSCLTLSMFLIFFFRDGTFHTEYNRPETFKVSFFNIKLDTDQAGNACIRSICGNCIVIAVILDIWSVARYPWLSKGFNWKCIFFCYYIFNCLSRPHQCREK